MWTELFSLIGLFVFGSATPLDDYVWAPDDNYGWVYMGEELDFNGTFGNCSYKGYYVNMTSQRWLSDKDFAEDSVSHSIWWHTLLIIVPDEIKLKRNATLYISGGMMGIPANNESDVTMAIAYACITGAVAGALYQIPNQNVTYAADPTHLNRWENSVLSFTWERFLNDPTQPNWIVRFPMVKASVRAMDAITDFVNQHLPQLGCQLDYYLVSGGSKRGWTTWLVGAVDPVRVKAIIPIVLDAVNFIPFVHHQFRSYGGWSFAWIDFINTKYVDPYYYFDRLTMPKMMINGGMDEFMQPDDTHLWWNDLPEPKYFHMTPNADHALNTAIWDVIPAMGAFGKAVFLNAPLPNFSWNLDVVNGKIVATVENSAQIYDANIWWAYSCGYNIFDNNKTRRDFRLYSYDTPCRCGQNITAGSLTGCYNLASSWSKWPLQPTIVNGKRTYTAKYQDLPSPRNDQWIAFIITFKFENPYISRDIIEEIRRLAKKEKANNLFQIKRPNKFFDIPEDFGYYLEFTTEAIVWPNSYPYEDCYMESCGTTLV